MQSLPRTRLLGTVISCFTCVSIAVAQPSAKTWVEKLGSGEITERREAADKLGEFHSESQLVPELARALKDSDAGVRGRSARSLSRFGPRAAAAVGALAETLGDEKPMVRAYAAYALGEIGEAAKPVVEQLAKGLVDTDPRVRRAVVTALSEIRPGPAVSIPLLTKVLNDADPSVIVPALQTLADSGEEAVPFLVEALKDKDACYWACLVVADLGPAAAPAVPGLVRAAQMEEPEVRMQALLALAAIGSEAESALPSIIAALDDEQNSVRYAAVFALGRIAKSDAVAEEKLREMLAADQKDAFLQLVSAYALARLHPDDQQLVKQAVELMVNNLKNSDPNVRSGAARALVELNAPPEVVAPVLIAALEDADPEVLAIVADAAATQGAKIVPRLIRGLENPKLRYLAATVLARIGPDAQAAVPALIAGLEDDETEFRREAIFALASIGPAAAEAVPALIQCMGDEEERVRNSACYALGRIGPEAADAVRPLAANLKSDDEFLRLSSAWALVGIRPDDARVAGVAVPLLIKGLREHEEEMVRAETARALGNIGAVAKSAIPALKEAANDPSDVVRAEAAEALRKIQAAG